VRGGKSTRVELMSDLMGRVKSICTIKFCLFMYAKAVLRRPMFLYFLLYISAFMYVICHYDVRASILGGGVGFGDTSATCCRSHVLREKYTTILVFLLHAFSPSLPASRFLPPPAADSTWQQYSSLPDGFRVKIHSLPRSRSLGRRRQSPWNAVSSRPRSRSQHCKFFAEHWTLEGQSGALRSG
jgi:hypothetical protein